MRHGKNKKCLNMERSHRDAVVKNLLISLLKYGKIETTLAKAKVVVPYMEKMITKAKDENLSNTKYILSKVGASNVKNVYEISKKFIDRKGGYLKVVKTWQRYGDAAKTAIVEFVL